MLTPGYFQNEEVVNISTEGPDCLLSSPIRLSHRGTFSQQRSVAHLCPSLGVVIYDADHSIVLSVG